MITFFVTALLADLSLLSHLEVYLVAFSQLGNDAPLIYPSSNSLFCSLSAAVARCMLVTIGLLRKTMLVE